MNSLPITIDLDLQRNFIKNGRWEILTADPSSPLESMYYWNSTLKRLRYHTGTGWKNVAQSHADLEGLDQDNHSIYVHTGVSRTITAVHNFAPAAASPPFNLGPNAQGQLVTGLNADKLDGYEATAFSQVGHTHTSSQINDLLAFVTAVRLNQLATPTSSVSMGGNRLTSLADPTQPDDAVNKRYVDARAAGMDLKEAVRVLYKPVSNSGSDPYISTDTIPAIVDGITITSVGTRVLVLTDYPAEQPKQGIYVVTGFNNGIPTIARAPDANGSSETTGVSNVTTGMTASVLAGATYRGSSWVLLTDDPITVGTTPLTFTQQSGPGDTIGSSTHNGGYPIYWGREGNVLLFRAITGNGGITMSMGDGTANSKTYSNGLITITFDPTQVNVANFTGVRQVSGGGTGATTASQARINLGAVGRYTQVIGNGSASSFQVNHNYGNRIVDPSVFETASPYRKVIAGVELTDPNYCTITFNTPPTTNQFTVRVNV